MLVEPGPTLARSFFEVGVADRLWIVRSPNAIEDVCAPRAAPIPDHWRKVAEVEIDRDTLSEYLNTRSPLFFAPDPSADFLLAASRL
jgi:riboflavin biosynthesis pyrimidine reductase